MAWVLDKELAAKRDQALATLQGAVDQLAGITEKARIAADRTLSVMGSGYAYGDTLVRDITEANRTLQRCQASVHAAIAHLRSLEPVKWVP